MSEAAVTEHVCAAHTRPAAAPIVPGLPASYAREPATRFSGSSNTTLPRMETSLTGTTVSGVMPPLTSLSSGSAALLQESSRESLGDFAGDSVKPDFGPDHADPHLGCSTLCHCSCAYFVPVLHDDAGSVNVISMIALLYLYLDVLLYFQRHRPARALSSAWFAAPVADLGCCYSGGGALPRAESLSSEPTLAGLTSFLAAAMADSRGASYPPLGSYLRASSGGRLPTGCGSFSSIFNYYLFCSKNFK